jgi:hypothetical protein
MACSDPADIVAFPGLEFGRAALHPLIQFGARLRHQRWADTI